MRDCLASYIRQRWGLAVSLMSITVLALVIVLRTNVFYVVPYRDMVIGIYPPSRIVDLLVSPWSPENFGQPASLPMLYTVLYVFEEILPPVKAFITYTLAPYIVAVLVAYYVLREQLGIRDEALLAAFSIMASINWFTLYSYGSTYVIYTYLGSLLALGTLYRIHSENNLDPKLIMVELAIAMLLAVAGWNLPGLALLYILLVANLPILATRPRLLLRALRYILASTVATLAVAAPFLYAKLFGLLYYGFRDYVVKAGYIPVGQEWLKILMPYYFKKYIGNILKVFMLPFDPLLENPVYITAAAAVAVMFAYILTKARTVHGAARTFYIYQLAYITIISFLAFLIATRSSIINILYDSIPLLSVLKSVTNYMVILLPSILMTIYWSIASLERREVRYAVAITLLVLAVASNNLLIVKLANIGNEASLHIGGYDYKLFKINASIVRIFNEINAMKGWCRRAIWMPLYPQERSMFTSVFEDIPISKATSSTMASQIDVMLTNLLTNNTLYTQNITMTLLRIYGVQYIVVVKNIVDTEPPRIVYYGISPVGVIGSYKQIIEALRSKQYLSEVYNDSIVTIFKFNDNVTIYNLYRNNNYTIQRYFIRILSDNSTLLKIVEPPVVTLSRSENKTIYITVMSKKIYKFIISLVLRYSEVDSLYGNVIKLFDSIRILVKKNGQLLVQVRTSNGTLNYFSKKTISPEKFHYIVVIFDNGRLRLFIDGMFDGEMRAPVNSVELKSGRVVIGSSDGYNIDIVIGSIDVELGTSVLHGKVFTERALQVLGINRTVERLRASCPRLWFCGLQVMDGASFDEHGASSIVVSNNLEPFWEVKGNSIAYNMSSLLSGFTLIYVKGPIGVVTLKIAPRFLMLKMSLLAVSLTGLAWLTLRMASFVKRYSGCVGGGAG